MANRTENLTIQIDNLSEAQSLAIQDMLAMWVSLGRSGSSRMVSFYADGDGDFHPRIDINSTDCFVPPKQFGTPEEIQARWKKDVYEIDYDEIAGKLRRAKEAAEPKIDSAPAWERMRDSRTLLDGSPVVDDSHREIEPATGMQKSYVILSSVERAKGLVRPVRDTYRHTVCRQTTRMSHSIAETYARDPSFYTGTYCSNCCGHYPVGESGEFVWLDGTKVGT
jgi:hypothetical protein